MMIIANPRAGHGRGERSIRGLRDAIRRRGYDCTPVPTERPGHATELARRAAEAGEPRLIVMGGDGTISEVVNGLVGSETELGIVPMGTGNDVARSLRIPRGDLAAALDLAVQGETAPVDVGRERDRHFISVAGVGFPAIVADEANSFVRLHGSAAFFVAVYKALHRLRAFPFTLRLDDRTLEMEGVAVMIQNTPFTGGGLKMAPDARVDDGLLDVVVVDDIGRTGLMLNFPRAYTGRHLEHPSFSVHRAARVAVDTPEPMTKMFDGDLCGRTPLEADVVAGGVRIAVPAGSAA
jgi:diacylglycerol kinase (ATP)